MLDKFFVLTAFLKNYLWEFVKFLVSFGMGFLFCCLVYILIFLKNMKKETQKLVILNKNVNSKTETEVFNLIQNTIQQFKTEMKDSQEEYMNVLLKNLNLLSHQIIRVFYPHSPYPYLELTIEESLLLFKYIDVRLEKLFTNKILKIFKKVTLRKIFVLRQAFVENKIAERYKTTRKKLSFVSNVVNVINPFYWFKKLVLDKSMYLVFSKIGESVIVIVGESVYQIYSKKMFSPKKESEIDLINLAENIIDEANQEKQKKQKDIKKN